MTQDIIERAEAAIDDLARNGEPESCTGMFAEIVNTLVTELKEARSELAWYRRELGK